MLTATMLKSCVFAVAENKKNINNLGIGSIKTHPPHAIGHVGGEGKAQAVEGVLPFKLTGVGLLAFYHLFQFVKRLALFIVHTHV